MRIRPVPHTRPGVSAGLLGLRPKRTASRGFAPCCYARAAYAARGFGRLIGPMAQTHGLQGLRPLLLRLVPHTRPGVSAGLLGQWPKRTASRGFAPCCYAPCRIRGPGFRPAYWACGPNARPPGASPPAATPRAAYAARGFGRLIGPMAQTHGLQGLRPLRLRPVPPAVRSAYTRAPDFVRNPGPLLAPARQSNWTERSALPVMAFWRHLPRRKK